MKPIQLSDAKHALCFAFFIALTNGIAAQNWLTTGNAGLTSSNFFGTTDGANVVFKANNIERGRLTASNGLWRFGNSSNFAKIDSAGKLSFSGTGDYIVGNNKYVFRFGGDPDYGLFFNSTNFVYEFRDANAAPVFSVNANTGDGIFKNTLKVGAYTFPATDGIPNQVLTTNGAGALTWANAVSIIGSNGIAVDGVYPNFTVNAGGLWSTHGNAGTSPISNFIGTTDATDFVIRTQDTSRLRIAGTNGRVGINSSTLNARLQVNGEPGEDAFRVQVDGLTKLYVAGNSGVSIGAFLTGPPNGLFVAGSVGIGTSSSSLPHAKLHVAGGTEANLANGGFVLVGDTNTINVVMDNDEIQARNNGVASALELNPAGGKVQIQTGAEASLISGGFFVIGDTASANMAMDNNEVQARTNNTKATLFLNPAGGLVSIGDDLDVNGDSISLGSAEKLTDAGNNVIGSNSHFIPLSDNVRELGTSTNRWFDVWAVDGTINTSDARDKQNIRDLNYGLDDVMKLHPIKFNWKTGDDPNDKLGLIAQELQKVIPEVVRDYDLKTDEATGKNEKVASARLGVMYADLIPVLINAIQQQQKEIEELKKQQSLSVTNTGATDINVMSITLSSAFLEQNVPNPFGNTTSVHYSVPANATSAQIIFKDNSGKTLKQIQLS
ncbi:MAG TPA: tail fiber domain-containing protein, partial [Parafilimonas sp.]|nr:tail fiber domain-containing protein [Parafilimonas sp.]